jgi:hypothetical protein
MDLILLFLCKGFNIHSVSSWFCIFSEFRRYTKLDLFDEYHQTLNCEL